MKPKRILSLTAKSLEEGGASVIGTMNYEAGIDSKKTAVAKSMSFLNQFCHTQDLGFFLALHDAKTGKPLKVTLAE